MLLVVYALLGIVEPLNHVNCRERLSMKCSDAMRFVLLCHMVSLFRWQRDKCQMSLVVNGCHVYLCWTGSYILPFQFSDIPHVEPPGNNKGRLQCPELCHTQGFPRSKSCMSKAREMVKVMQEGENLEGDDDDEAEGEDLAASIMRWMSEQDPKLTESHQNNTIHALWLWVRNVPLQLCMNDIGVELFGCSNLATISFVKDALKFDLGAVSMKYYEILLYDTVCVVGVYMGSSNQLSDLSGCSRLPFLDCLVQ